jgi:hypothetical protein
MANQMMSVDKTQTLCCTFCLNMGIAEPHDHIIRDFSKKDKPIMCPQLLSIECGYCHQVGHTKNYCSVLKEKNTATNYATNPVTTPNVSSHKKRVQTIDNDGFVCLSPTSGKNTEVVCEQKKVQKIGNVMSAFGALTVDCDSEYDCDSESDMVDETCVMKKPLWTEIVSSNKEKQNIFATSQELKDLVGIKNDSRWADIDD